MKKRKSSFFIGVALSAMALLTVSGCGSSDDPVYSTVSARVTGLGSGDTVVLQNNGGDDLSVTVDGTSGFATQVVYGGGYDVTVKTQPSSVVCVADSPKGTVTGAVTVDVACVSTVTVSGTIEDGADSSAVDLTGVTVEARNPKDDSLIVSAVTTQGASVVGGGYSGGFSLDVPAGHDFYLHVAGQSVGGTAYVGTSLQIENETAARGGVKFYLVDQSTVDTALTALGFSANDAIFSMDVEDGSSNGIAGVTVAANPAVSHIFYQQSDGHFADTGQTDAYNGVMGNVAAPGGNGTYAFTLSPDKTSGGAYDYTIDQTFSLRLIPGEISSPIAP